MPMHLTMTIIKADEVNDANALKPYIGESLKTPKFRFYTI